MHRTKLLACSLVLAAAAAVPVVSACGPAPAVSASAPAGKYACDTVHSYVMFKILHMGASWNYGRFNDFTASFDATDGGAELKSVAFDVKAASVDTGNAKRDDHLRSPDFLNAKQFPSIAFKSTSAKAVDDKTTELQGDLTLHGVTKPVTARAVRVGAGKGMDGEALVGFECQFTIARKDFEITTYPAALGDDITILVAVEGAKK